MATRLAIDQRVEIELKSLRLMLGDLPEVAQEWDELSDGERVSRSLDWDQSPPPPSREDDQDGPS